MWNMDYIYDFPLGVKILILLSGLGIFLVSYRVGSRGNEREEDKRCISPKGVNKYTKSGERREKR